ncbi:translocation protein TolB (plasmid) [Bacillus sp. N447-1]|uniref:translocation protein TolB n=1 Tax=Bacillus sp. N447-1 TaxID=2789208 RepID=UPI001F61D352|nr:translocation protein TolB [Bacillus sp. N447-1]UNT71673.1 translocation protein TolB [Bacillus sp. N447-1]
MKKIIIFFAIFILSIQPFSFISAESNEKLKAAFVKNNDLWVKIEDKEMRITQGEYVRFPKWSFDGNWIAYIRGGKEDEFPIYKGDFWLYNVKLNQHVKVLSNVERNFQWAPNKNVLAFQSDNVLKTINVRSLNPHHNITSGIKNFSWLPDGSGFLTSSKTSESIHSDILLSKITFKKGENINRVDVRPLYKISVSKNFTKNDYPFVSTSQFKWSKDQKWIAFQLIPTASLSSDSNTLAVLSNDGHSFYKIDEMLNYEEWFQWAPSNNFLGYIQGFNREAIKNKELKVTEIDKNIYSQYTPKGYVNRDLTWETDNSLFVSRSIESKWVDVKQRPMPSLYKIDIQTKTSKEITSPSSSEGDFRPQYIINENKLIWIRTNREKANVWIADSNGLNQKIWIENINPGTWYYEHWDWDEVFSLYQP